MWSAKQTSHRKTLIKEDTFKEDIQFTCSRGFTSFLLIASLATLMDTLS